MLLLRARRCTTAVQLAEWLEVSERTIYRDIQDLQASGSPIDGEAGIGYRLKKTGDIPPLFFNPDEIKALLLGARMVSAWADTGIRQSARAAITKLDAVLPSELKEQIAEHPVYVPSIHPYPVERLQPIREAIAASQKLFIAYQKEDGTASERIVWPLGLFFWGDRWTLVAWCEGRDDFRHFRLDRMQSFAVQSEVFQLSEGQTLQDFFHREGVRLPGV